MRIAWLAGMGCSAGFLIGLVSGGILMVLSSSAPLWKRLARHGAPGQVTDMHLLESSNHRYCIIYSRKIAPAPASSHVAGRTAERSDADAIFMNAHDRRHAPVAHADVAAHPSVARYVAVGQE